MTPEEKKELRSRADEADKSIRRLPHHEVPSVIASGVHILFFGAVWCKYTQRFTPKWLAVQQKADANGWNKADGFGYYKVECSEDEESGYPTINLYVDGAYYEEYLGADDVDPTLDYLHFQLSTKVQNATVRSNLALAPTYPGFIGSALGQDAEEAVMKKHMSDSETDSHSEVKGGEGVDGSTDEGLVMVSKNVVLGVAITGGFIMMTALAGCTGAIGRINPLLSFYVGGLVLCWLLLLGFGIFFIKGYLNNHDAWAKLSQSEWGALPDLSKDYFHSTAADSNKEFLFTRATHFI
ncbi:hypothetical protein DFJ73DRAFT_779742 [Zopfochytrium polystomum]|nr:hypothetical protein DFJ73DRAFT_779742 [Zopfochytrium polystomum]